MKNEVLKKFKDSLMGKTIEEVDVILQPYKILSYRIIREDDEAYNVTMDLNMFRFNLQLDNGVVTEISIG